MLAGILGGLIRDVPLHDLLKLGVAAGTAATLAAGTQLFATEDVQRWFAELQG